MMGPQGWLHGVRCEQQDGNTDLSANISEVSRFILAVVGAQGFFAGGLADCLFR